MNPVSLFGANQDGPGQDDPLERLLRGVHENFAEACGASLSAFLQTEIGITLESVSFPKAGEFRSLLEAPSGVVAFELEPGGERTLLVLDCTAAFSLLELLLGGDPAGDPSGATQVEGRNFTEIEWALLEELVRVVVAPLGQVWTSFRAVEFKVLTLENDPQMLALADAAQALVHLEFALAAAGRAGHMRVGVPRSFFDPGSGKDEPPPGPPGAEPWRRNLDLLGEAKVELQVMLEGPAMQLRELASLRAGQVVRFDYPLQKPLRAVVNDEIPMSGKIVNAGRKRAFQVEALP